MRITSKGQDTIPQAIREKAGLLPHTEVEFHYTRGRVVLKPVAKPKLAGEETMSPIRAAIRRARGSANEPKFRGWSTDQIIAFLRGDDLSLSALLSRVNRARITPCLRAYWSTATC